ncbi:hypothetical protein KY360_06570 [Candidatus Woesearchaeota archaeon]|nr:hypothetical protein [Candidatus Woesearchaeota archaeon]
MAKKRNKKSRQERLRDKGKVRKAQKPGFRQPARAPTPVVQEKVEAPEQQSSWYRIPLIGTAIAAGAALVIGLASWYSSANSFPESPGPKKPETELPTPKKRKQFLPKGLELATQTAPLESRLGDIYKTTEQREQYVRKITGLIQIPHYVQSIEYKTEIEPGPEDNNVYQRSRPSMFTGNVTGTWRDIGRKRTKAKTTITPGAFDSSCRNKEEFILGLKHEMNIAKIFWEGFDDVPMEAFYYKYKKGQEKFIHTLFTLIAELESYDKDIKRAVSGGFDDYRIKMLKRHFLKYYSALSDKNPPAHLEDRLKKLRKMFHRPWMDNPNSYSHTLDLSKGVNFETARVNPDPRLRQAYLDHVFRNRAWYGDNAWNSFISIQYDPYFKKSDAVFPEGTTVYGGKDEVNLACTPIGMRTRTQKSHTYVSQNAFIFCDDEDELLSLLDNEASTAILWHKGKMHFPIRYKALASDFDNYFKVVELVSFDAQFTNILKGKRKVSSAYLDRFTPPAKDLFAEVVGRSKQNIPDAPYLGVVVESIRARPTISYFE